MPKFTGKYTPLPKGYVICKVCGMGEHKEIYDMCMSCLSKSNPELYRNIVSPGNAQKRVTKAGGVDGGTLA